MPDLIIDLLKKKNMASNHSSGWLIATADFGVKRGENE